ncbi:MAG: DEAD/DEAH box helicase [Chloroflexi bacterium]|nr:DEAD/DEAH box helicase [Chloroflexota bacterium]
MTSPQTILDRLRFDARYMTNVYAWETIRPREARYADIPDELDKNLIAALRQRGIDSLFTHQTAAIAASLNGDHVAVVTGTASGKTLCYNLPVLQSLILNHSSRALYLFPTKALAQDQAAELTNYQLPITARIYDGDTPQPQRAAIRQEAQLLITNPDMLHTGILPHHTKWGEFFAELRYVVIDEMHTYRGVFGSHFANVLRRLKRICKFYGSEPQFILTSATIANPKELAEKLIEDDVTLIDDDGSPRSEKHFILYNPPMIDPKLGLRRSFTLATKEIAAQFINENIKTVIFARTRSAVELLLMYIRDVADEKNVRGYRGGYLPNERREIERGLRDGSVRGVVATNALELGVDIGQLSVAIIAGYPGSIASVWQQAGRVGRRGESSAVIMVASAAPLDQYIAMHPRFLFESSIEHALIDPNNLAILVNHLRCAIFELPFERDEMFGRLEIGDLIEAMKESGELHESAGAVRWVGSAYPSDSVSLRAASDDVVVIQDVTNTKPILIGEVDATRAPTQVHAGAVYLHEGKQFLVRELKWDERIAEVIAADELDYYTQASEGAALDVLDVFDANESRDARKAHGSVLVTSQATTYRKIKRYTHETLGVGEIDLPPREFQTTAYWLWFSDEALEKLKEFGISFEPNDYGPNWETQRKLVLERDEFKCRECGATSPLPLSGVLNGRGVRGEGLHVHHLRPFREFGYVRGDHRLPIVSRQN